MKKLLLLTLIGLFSCTHTVEFNPIPDDQIDKNIESVFGVQFPERDWSTAENSSIKVKAVNMKVQVLVSTKTNDDNVNMTILNEANVNEEAILTFDTPKEYESLFVAFIDENGEYTYIPFRLGDSEVSIPSKTRTLSQDYQLPPVPSEITGTVESWANKREWLPGEVFYLYDSKVINSNDYSTEFKATFDNVIFNYFKNGRSHNNLPLIKKSGYYNESSYPITTGDEPIIISPVYKNDGGYKEIAFAELYYYYFKGDLNVQEIESLPKYRVIDLSTVYSNDDNGSVIKHKSYALVYWGSDGPSYQFPKGYKIGFMYKSNTEYEKPKKQGELYGDGRLNYNINNWGNFKSSGLELTAPRMAWMSVNKHMFLCIESGTDADFNDLICEVEGGIEPIVIPPPVEYNSYVFMYEDHKLGDYDMNDVVLKGERLSETQVRWTLMASGAYDELFIHNINGTHINSNTEVHAIFGKQPMTYINTEKGDNVPYVTDIVNVSKTYSFLDVTTQPYIYNKTKGWDVKIVRIGRDPRAIMIPYDIKWPLERVRISKAYLQFNSWGTGSVEDNEWYKYPEIELVFNKN